MLGIKFGLILSAILALTGVFHWFGERRRLTREGDLLDCALEAGAREREEEETRRMQEEKEAREQADRVFGLDFLITHGGAFGGCSSICPDGKKRRGTVALDQIMMYGQQASGKEYTYYIEDQGLLICAADEADQLILKTQDQPFEIREAGLDRDQGLITDYARIRKDILYYVILESHHEISIMASN